jgi:hypothetical protein
MFKIIIFCLICFNFLIADNDCRQCHPKEYKKCQNSNHTTLKNSINITREIWGIKESNVTLQTIPKAKEIIQMPQDLVDDFLRRKCLKCHLGITKSGESGMQRGKSCLACHTKHQKKGQCQSQKISNDKCLSCHNKQFVGTDYLGLFPKDHHHSFRAPLTKEGQYPSQKYGIDHHRLSEDIHHTIGMGCVDCHNTKGDKNWESGVQCTSCHQQLTTQNHPDYHKNIDCSTCHSIWNMSSYELSVFRDDTADYKKWKDLTLQEDGYLTNFLNRALKSKNAPKPMMPDWVDKKMKPGIWYSGYRFKRWEHFVLGNDLDGKIKILRPMFQYRISYRNSDGTMVFDDLHRWDKQKIEGWLPYTPHTIGTKAKSCEKCHNNTLIIDQKQTDNEILNLMKPYTIINGSPLTTQQIHKLTSDKYKHIRAKMLWK